MATKWFPDWSIRRTHQDGQVIATDERLPWPQTLLMGLQHTFAMFGATVLAPLLMGFDPNLMIFISGFGTLLFFLLVGGRVPSYLGSSFAVIGAVITVTGYAGQGTNPNLGIALGGTIACGLLYAFIGLVVMAIGTRWVERLMPPVVTGAVVMAIGLNLAPIAVKDVSGSDFDTIIALITVLSISGIAIFTRGLVQRLLILLGLIASYIVYIVLTNGLGFGQPIDFTGVAHAAWFGIPQFSQPVFDLNAMIMIAPVAIILVAENLGHIKAVSAMTGQNLDPYIGRAFFADGLSTTLSGSVGGTAMTTYAENIGVMAATRVYSSLVFVAAAGVAIFLGLSPKFGALIHTIPASILGGTAIVVFGLIAVAGARIWIQNKVDFSDNCNLLVAAVTLVCGAGNFAFHIGHFNLGGIGTATFIAIALYALLNWRSNSSHKSNATSNHPVIS
ncbi:solute carrier family 23 protein [Aquirhabdus sp.]|uniref:solute carrier family 23 protein n=1 Tax=Aquirhabdus sp. TaxID=2824160 RepID=UPI00396CCC2E